MATAPLLNANWFDEPRAAKLITQIKAADFRYDFHRNFIKAGGERSWLPDNAEAADLEEALEEARSAFIADLLGFSCDEHTSEEQMNDWIAADRLQATVSEVIGAAVRQRGHLGWKLANAIADAEDRRAVEIADSREEVK